MITALAGLAMLGTSMTLSENIVRDITRAHESLVKAKKFAGKMECKEALQRLANAEHDLGVVRMLIVKNGSDPAHKAAFQRVHGLAHDLQKDVLKCAAYGGDIR
jgi:hypothetical protein